MAKAWTWLSMEAVTAWAATLHGARTRTPPGNPPPHPAAAGAAGLAPAPAFPDPARSSTLRESFRLSPNKT